MAAPSPGTLGKQCWLALVGHASGATLDKDHSHHEASHGEKYIHVCIMTASDFSVILPAETVQADPSIR
jgi:hypothetical protein